VADAGALRCEVVTVARKSTSDEHRWVYLDVGMFSGLAEVMDEAIRYRVLTDGADRPSGPVVLAGPTCDSADILYETVDYQLPLDLRAGERLYLQSVGAYSTTYSTIGFNGFPPLDVEVLR
jgi:ornithine decarboxylase